MYRLPCLALLVFVAPELSATPGATGELCIAPATPPSPGKKSLANPAGENRIQQYTIEVDALAPVVVAHDQGKLLSSLALDGAHWVRVRGDGKLVESFKFQFSSYESSRLCLFFNELYETWNLQAGKPAQFRCQCED